MTSPHRSNDKTIMPKEQDKKIAGQCGPMTGYLYTPPEHMADSFSHDDEHTQSPKGWHPNILPPMQALSPPTSPEAGTLPSLASATGFVTQDKPLYPDDHGRGRSTTPLFHSERNETPPSNHASPAEQVDNTASLTNPSQNIGYPANLGVTTPKAAMQYYHDRIAELQGMRSNVSWRLPRPQRSPSADRDVVSQKMVNALTKPAGVSKTPPPPRTTLRHKTTASKPSPLAKSQAPTKRRTPKARTPDLYADASLTATNQPSTKHKRAPPSKKVEGDNAAWLTLPDYSPPLSSLSTPGTKPLKAAWKGSPLDLRSDPDRAHCHAQELDVASVLRLSCAAYLSNKRKIFTARVAAAREGRHFTKTAAQGACSIDVNKASQLWEAFEKVGWFEEGWFEKFVG